MPQKPCVRHQCSLCFVAWSSVEACSEHILQISVMDMMSPINKHRIEERIRESFQKQGLMRTLQAQLASVEWGRVKIECRKNENVTQQDGYFHAGTITAIVDSACGYAALTQMPEKHDVLSVEFKVNLLRPANTTAIIAIGEVVKAGRTLTFCEGKVFDETEERLLATMTATMISIAH